MTLTRPRRVTTDHWETADGERLRSGLERLAITMHASAIPALEHYARLLLKWNQTYNLLGATTKAALIDDHLLDSLTVITPLERWLAPVSGLLHDVGSGAGLPGVPVAIARPDWPLILIEPVGKKAAFMRQVIAECRLTNVRIIEGRIETLAAPAAGDPPRHFICRAFTTLDRFASLCAPHQSRHSLLFAMKSIRVTEELNTLPPSVRLLAHETLPPATPGTCRSLVIMTSTDGYADNRSTDWPSS